LNIEGWRLALALFLIKETMTVREYIEHLKTLDQDKGIWVAYDFPCDMFEPIPDEVATEHHAMVFGEEVVKIGDYVISAG
jgi:hypothetical protein